MSVLIVLIVISLVLAVGFLIAFLWATKSGQFNDSVTPSMRILLEDEIDSKPNPNDNNTKERSIHE
jgi:cbb3-type cytochrome oxidase maturation protein